MKSCLRLVILVLQVSILMLIEAEKFVSMNIRFVLKRWFLKSLLGLFKSKFGGDHEAIEKRARELI